MIIPQQNAYSGVTAGVQLVNRRGALHRVVLTAGSANATATFYDNTSATGSPILTVAALAGTSAWPDADGFEFLTALFAVVSGTGAQVNVFFE
ncbi:MAG: hypothetical protein ACYDBJ_04480 [Aggregatilineales bacterium]